MIRFVKHIFQLIELIPCFLVLATVFVVNRDLANGVVSGKYFWFYLSMGILAVMSVVAVAKSAKPVRITLNDCLVLLFGLITMSVSYFVNGSEAITKHILLVLIILLYFFLKMAFQTQKAARYWLPVFMMMTGLIEAIWGLRQLYGYTASQHSLFRLTGSFFNPGPYSCYLVVVLPVALYYLAPSNSPKREGELPPSLGGAMRGFRVLSYLTFISMLLVLPAGMSRAAWLAGIGGCGTVLLFGFNAGRLRKRCASVLKSATLRVIGIAVVLMLLLAGSAGMYLLKKDSADGRAFIWKNTVRTIQHHPMGVGIGHFSGSYGETQAAYFASGRGTEREEFVAGNPEYAFNEYLQVCIEHGIIPFMFFVGIMGYSMYIGFRRKRIAATASLVALLIVALSSYPFSVLPFLIVLALLLAWIHAGEQGISISRMMSICITLFCTILVSACLYNRYPTLDAYKKWNTGKFYYNAGLFKDVVKNYKELYPLLNDQIAFLFEYAQSLSKTEQYADSNEVLQKAMQISCDPMLFNVMGRNRQAMNQYVAAEQCFIQSSHIVPNRIYPYYLLALMYMDAGETEKAKATAQIVLTKEPKVHSTAVNEMREEARKLLTANDE